MSYISNALYAKGTGIDQSAPGETAKYFGRVGKLSTGGPYGYTVNPTDWINLQPYVRQQMIILLLDVPKMYSPEWNYVNNPNEWILAWKAMFETKPLSVEGFGSKLTVNSGEYQLGSGADMFFQIPIGVTRQRSNPVFTYPSDHIGRPINTMVKHLIEHGLKSPDTRTALLHTVRQNSDDPTRDTLADVYTFTYLAIQPDVSGKIVEEAFLVRNAYYTESPDANHSMNQTADIDLEQITLPMAGMVINNHQTRILATGLLSKIKLAGAALPENVPIAHDSEELSGAILEIEGNHTAGYSESVDVTRPDNGSVYATPSEATMV